jgi:hypothetical protein
VEIRAWACRNVSVAESGMIVISVRTDQVHPGWGRKCPSDLSEALSMALQRLLFLIHTTTGLIVRELNRATALQRLSPLPAKLPTSAPLSAEKTRLTLNCALAVHLEKSMGTSTSAWPPGEILFSSIGNGRSAFA